MRSKINLYTVKVEDVGNRIDKFFLKKNSQLSFSVIQKQIRIGYIKVNSLKVKANYKIQEKDIIQYGLSISFVNDVKNDTSIKKIYSEEIARIKEKIIFEDNELVALNKPSGIAVQGGSKIKLNIDLILPYLIESKEKLRLVHRIDKFTSGILILAKTKEASRKITKLFKENKVKKKYWAIVLGAPKKEKGKIVLPLNKKFISGQEKVVVDHDSEKYAETYYSIKEKTEKLSLLEIVPKTGRTHQIRVHLQSIDKPILGDYKYYTRSDKVKYKEKINMHLHAKELNFNLDGQKYSLSASLPQYFKNTLIEKFRKKYD